MARRKKPASAPSEGLSPFARAMMGATPKAAPKAKRQGKRRAKPAHPERQDSKGRVLFSSPLGVNSARGKRPALERIGAWIERRRHVKAWRNRDGSYDAIVTIYGGKAWQVARNLALSAPRPCYIAFRYQVYAATKSPLARHRGKSGGSLSVMGVEVLHASSPTCRARKQAVDWSLTYPMAEPGLRRDVAGLAVFWPGPNYPERKG